MVSPSVKSWEFLFIFVLIHIAYIIKVYYEGRFYAPFFI